MTECERLLNVLIPLVEVTAPGIFRLSGNSVRQQKLNEAIRSGQDTKSLELNPHDLATVMKQIVREYPGRLLDTDTEKELVKICKNNGADCLHQFQDVLRSLPAEKYSILTLVVPFFHNVAVLADVNKMDAANLARVIALDFFQDINNPMGADTTLVRQLLDWRIKVMEKLILFGDSVFETPMIPSTPISLINNGSVTPVNEKRNSTTNIFNNDASQKRKRPPQSPLKCRPESTPPNGTPSFFSKFSNRLCPSGKKVRHEDEIDACGYRSDDNLLRCPPVKQNLRTKFSHKKKSPKMTTPNSRLHHKTAHTPFSTNNYGTFNQQPFPADQAPMQVRTELFDFTHSTELSVSMCANKDDESMQQANGTFVFSSQQNLSQPPTMASKPPFFSNRNLSPVNISPTMNMTEDDDDSRNPLVDTRCTGDSTTGDSNSGSECKLDSEYFAVDAPEPMDDVMETATSSSDLDIGSVVATCLSVETPDKVPDPSPASSNFADEMRDSLADLINVGGTPRCRLPVTEKSLNEPPFQVPVIETTFDENEAESRLIAQVRRQLGARTNANVACRRPSLADLQRMGQVSQGRLMWEQATGVSTASTLTLPLPPTSTHHKSEPEYATMQQPSFLRSESSSKHHTLL